MSNMFAGLMMLESGLSDSIAEDIRSAFSKNPQFYVRKDKNNSALFFNTDKKCFCCTSSIVKCEKHSNGYMKLMTQNDHTYSLTTAVSVNTDFPLAESNGNEKTNKLENEKDTTKLEVIDKKSSTHGINYGDGYNKTVFTFNHSLTETEFISFCVSNGYKIHKAEGWWDCYSIITKLDSNGTKWEYHWNLTYTD